MLLQRYGSISNLWSLNKNELQKNVFLSNELISEFTNSFYKKDLEKYLNYMKNNNIKILTYKDNEYPQKLHFIQNKPIVLFMKGNISNLNNESIAVVGARDCSVYGIKNAYFFSKELSKKGVNIVSGLAKGIDGIAHQACIKAGGKTIAVIGNGLENIYPKENQKLAENILESGGTIISEFIVGTKPEAKNFPRRNRIISGISNAVIVVEAGIKSGSLITANYAIEQGKEVWAIPGNIYSYTSMGTNELIKDGANVLTCLNDILV